MKVLHVNEHQAIRGGVETYLYALIPHLADRGVRSVVVYGEGKPSLHEPSHSAPAIGQAGFTWQRSASRQLETILDTERPDLVHVHNVQNIGVLQACLEYGPTVMTAHDYRWVCPANTFFYKRTQDICGRTCGLGCFTTTLAKHCLTPRPQYAGYFYYRAQWAIRHASEFAQVIAPSRGAAERYQQSGFPAESMTVLPYFCSISPAPRPRPLPNRPTITYLGRIAPNKGHEYFVEALGRLPERVRGIMVGSITNDQGTRLMEQAHSNGCAGRLELHPWASREEVLEVLDRTSVFIFPSLWPETLGIVGIEALSRGVPVVASEVGGVGEWCLDGETGYVVPPRDATAIADRVEYLLSDEQRLRAFGERGIALIQEKFLPERHVYQLLRIYQQVLSPDPSPKDVYV